MMKRTTIFLTNEQIIALKKYAKKVGLNPAQIIRMAINFYLEYMTGKKEK